MLRIDFFCPRWGFETVDWNVFLRRVKRAGYAGIEWFPFGEKCDHQHVLSLLKKFKLEFCIVMTVTEPYKNINDYIINLKRDLYKLATIGGNNCAPLFITAQTGREYFTIEDVDACLKACSEVSEKTGIEIFQETHRNKWSYASHVVYDGLKRNKNVELTLDVSHWFCVSESYLEDQQAAVHLALKRTRHIHARVGSTQGPQVFDPALTYYRHTLTEHLKIWDEYVKSTFLKKERCTITPEFGPPPYMQIRKSISRIIEEQWRLNLWMKDFLQKRYSKQFFQDKKK